MTCVVSISCCENESQFCLQTVYIETLCYIIVGPLPPPPPPPPPLPPGGKCK